MVSPPPDIIPTSMRDRNMSTVPAVEVEGAFKGYDSANLILDNFCMGVRRGMIYSLLGASGCGKTTLLSCIVGLRKLDKGTISVFGSKPGSNPSQIGYMPQDIALFKIFSIREILMYYGRIYGMETNDIQMRIQFISELLDLPDQNRRIQNLSGGQGRRVSLACAMFHNPELLILDEPTVGIDPLLRQSIWNHLTDIVIRNGTTVIITTHYIEETRQSDMIGLMRHGRLLTQDHPANLLKEYNTELLEDIILQLCKDDQKLRNSSSDEELNKIKKNASCPDNFVSEIDKPDNDNVVGIRYTTLAPDFNFNTHSQSSHKSQRRNCQSQNQFLMFSQGHYKKITAVFHGHFLSMLRHRVFLVLRIILPVIQLLICNYVIGREPQGLQVGVVNNDLLNGMNFQSYCLSRNQSCLEEGLSCNYLNMFQDESIKLVPMSSEAEALHNVRNGHSGFISIPKNFTMHMKNKFLWKNFVDNETIQGSMISVRLDLSDKLKGQLLVQTIYANYLKFLQNTIEQCGTDPRVISIPLNFHNAFDASKTINNFDADIKWTEFFQPSYIIWTIFLMPLINGILMTVDRSDGLMDRLSVSGVGFLDQAVARVTYESIIIIVQLVLCLTVLIEGFGMAVKGSLVLFVFISFLVGFTGLSFAFVIGTVSSHTMESIMATLFLYMILVPSSGGVWPIITVAPIVRTICYCTPVTLPLESLRAVLSRGWGFSHPVVWHGITIMMAWIALNSVVCGVFHRTRK